MLAATYKVDLQAVAPDGHRELLAIAEAGDWEQPDATWLLQEKLNAYAAYALDGQMHQLYPDSIGKPVSLVVSSVDPYPEEIAALLGQMKSTLEADGLTLVVKRVPLDQAA